MSRLILLAALGLVTWLYFPETRALLLDAVEPMATPVKRWSTQEEMERVAKHVVDHERLTGRVPTGQEWVEWLEFRYASPETTHDPWGSLYALQLSQDSVIVVSPGPDRVPRTEDDFHVSAPRG